MQNHILHDTRVESPGGNGHPSELKKREPCIFHVRNLASLRTHSSLIRLAISKTKTAVISMPESVADEAGLSGAIGAFPGLYAISVRYRLAPSQDGRYAGSPVSGQEGDLRVVARYGQLVESFRSAERGSVRVIPEIEVTDDLQLLGPTLMALSKQRPSWIVLATEGEPTKKRIAALRDSFEFLQIRDFPLIDIHFSFETGLARNWVARSECIYSGPEEFHIDLSNRCTHSCVYCALYAPAIISDLKATNRMDEGVRRFMAAELKEEKALELIQSLPLTTRLVQFGGAGDPMLHPKARELITHLRERAITVEVLSNMEYFEEGDHEKLTDLGGHLDRSLKFIANISGATVETYVRTRPRQTPAVFHKVMATLRKLSELRKRNGGLGVHFTMMCVLNRLNFHEAPLYVELTAKVGAAQAWLKPLEIHHRLHYDLLPTAQERPAYLRSLRLALDRADQLGVTIVDRKALEETIQAGGARSEELRP